MKPRWRPRLCEVLPVKLCTIAQTASCDAMHIGQASRQNLTLGWPGRRPVRNVSRTVQMGRCLQRTFIRFLLQGPCEYVLSAIGDWVEVYAARASKLPTELTHMLRRFELHTNKLRSLVLSGLFKVPTMAFGLLTLGKRPLFWVRTLEVPVGRTASLFSRLEHVLREAETTPRQLSPYTPAA